MGLLSHGGDTMRENGAGELPIHFLAEFGPGGNEKELGPALVQRRFAKSIRAQDLLLEFLRNHDQVTSAVQHAAAGDSGNTPLHAVARWNHPGAEHAARLLVSARADIEQRNAEGRTPLAIAMRRYGRNGKVVKVLQESGAKEPPREEDYLAEALGGCVRPLLLPGLGVEEQIHSLLLPGSGVGEQEQSWTVAAGG